MLSGSERTLPAHQGRGWYASLGLGALVLLLSGMLAARISGQTTSGKPAVLTRIEPGLENAVKWKWRVAPSDAKDWGLAVPTPTPSPSPVGAAATPTPTPENRPALYEVKHGDALILIGKKFGLTVEQLKAFNGLKTDLIRVGQNLKIPTAAELAKATPSPIPSTTPTPAKNPHTKKRKPPESPEQRISLEAGVDLDKLRLQIFLEREQFSGGPIAVNPDPFFSRILILYQSTH